VFHRLGAGPPGGEFERGVAILEAGIAQEAGRPQRDRSADTTGAIGRPNDGRPIS
jgi:hypothetical protein